MDSGVASQGFDLWRKDDDTTKIYYGEHRSTGPGSAKETRSPFVKQLSDREVKAFDTRVFLGGWDAEAEAAKLP